MILYQIDKCQKVYRSTEICKEQLRVVENRKESCAVFSANMPTSEQFSSMMTKHQKKLQIVVNEMHEL